jgi:CheY-like chemotaxis protein
MRIVTEMLRRLGHQPGGASNGREALDELRRAEYDAVLMDCQMPEMDGYEATRRIRKGGYGPDPRVPIVALSATVLSEDRQACAAAGMNEFLSKPLHMRELGDCLRRVSAAHANGANRPAGEARP